MSHNQLLESILNRTFSIPFNGSDWLVNYTEGDLFELNKKLINSKTKYPIIWLKQGYKISEDRHSGHIELSGCSFFLITLGDLNDTYKKRFETNYQNMLNPLYRLLIKIFDKSKGIRILNDMIDYYQFPFNDVSELTARDSQLGQRRLSENTTVSDIWDAIVIDNLNLKINMDCYPEFKT